MGLSFCFLTAFSLLLFHITNAHLASPLHQLCHSGERSALLQFKESLTINNEASAHRSAHAKFASWNLEEEDRDCCSWDGVKCNEDTGHVIKLNLTSSCIYGSINSSSSLFHLRHLEWLSLADNNFNYSKIPSEIMNLSRLSHLNLYNSSISGQIPSEIYQLSMLKDLILSYNYLSGKVSSSLGNLTKLVNLYLSFNHRLSGELPATIEGLASLNLLDADGCSFSGQVPSLGNLTKLKCLELSQNNFSSPPSASFSWIAKQTELSWLALANINLIGEFPSWLMNLTQLTYINFDLNQLTGPIPNWLANLNRLTILSLKSNQLRGYLPSQIGSLTQLTALDLSCNQFQGPVPSSISELKRLEYLDLHSNNLSGNVYIEELLPKLKSLIVLFLSANNLSLITRNTVNIRLQNKFVFLGLASCNLKEFPDFLNNQDQLELLDLSANKIPGKIPGWLLNVTTGNLQFVNLSYNLITGFDRGSVVLPWTHLVTLDLRSNKLQGPLPIPPESTIHYLVSNNLLTGKLAPWLCNLNSLRVLDLSHNFLSGVLPQCLSNSSYLLSILNLQSNTFHGSIPEIFKNATNLKMIDWSHNLLQGKIPRSLANCTMLEFLDLGNNQIADLFPSWLGTLPELKVLMLQSNRFHGEIGEPDTGFVFPKLRIIDLSHNRFSGKLPSKYFQCWNAIKVANKSQLKYMQDQPGQSLNYILPSSSAYIFDYSLQYIYAYSITMVNKGIEMNYGKVSNFLTGIILSNNKLIGKIPTSISELKGLNCLNLSGNNLLGHIPSSLGNLTVLESLDLSNNNLSGEIPRQLAELTSLAVFDVSDNNLTGQIPQGKQFNTFENSSFEGNPGLCGKPLSRNCEISESSQKEDQDSETPFEFGWKIVLTGYASGLIVGVVIGQTFTTRINVWFAKTLGMRVQGRRRKRGRRN